MFEFIKKIFAKKGALRRGVRFRNFSELIMPGLRLTEQGLVVVKRKGEIWAKLCLPPLALSAELSGSLVDGFTGQAKGKSSMSMEDVALKVFEHKGAGGVVPGSGGDPNAVHRQSASVPSA